MKTITLHFLLRFASPGLTGNDPKETNHTRLSAIVSDLRQLKIVTSNAWKNAPYRYHWRSTVDTATFKTSMP